MRTLGLALLLAGSASVAIPLPASPQSAAPADSVTAFVHVTVIPMDRERLLRDQTVVVRGDRIVALGPAHKVRVPAGARQVDGREQFLIPGLGDMHTHLRSYPGKDSTLASDALFAFVASGVTTIRDMHSGGPGSESQVKLGAWMLGLRTRLARGELLGPRLYTAGDPDYSSPAAAARSVAQLKADGHDFVKVYDDVWSPELYDSIKASANRVGLRMVGHVPVNGLEWALAAPYASMEHLVRYKAYLVGRDPDSLTLSERWRVDSAAPWNKPGYRFDDPVKLRAIAQATKRAGVWNCPTFDYEVGTVQGQVVKALHDAGAGLISGSDAGNELEDLLRGRGTVFFELERMVEVGLTPYEALATSTRNVAEFLGTLDSTGTIAVGKRADLLLLRADPLRDISHTRLRAGVMVAGRWWPGKELDRRLQEIDARLQAARPKQQNP